MHQRAEHVGRETRAFFIGEHGHGQRMTVVGTGGLAPLFAKHSTRLAHVDKDLTMAGLLKIYLLNRTTIRAGRDHHA